MHAAPIPSEFETRTNATYAALLWALSRPGLAQTLPDAGPAGVIDALIDRECAVYCEDAALSAVAQQAGAALVAPEAADHLFFCQPPAPEMLASLRQGSDLYPEGGATLILPARFGAGTGLRLTGPGVETAVEIAVGGIPAAFWAARRRTLRYPMGMEMFLLDGDQVIGLPRSTKIEVL